MTHPDTITPGGNRLVGSETNMPVLWSDIIVAALVALLFSGIFGTFLRFASPARGRVVLSAVVVLFAILFFAVWAGGVWLPRSGPATFGVRWLSFFVVGLLLTAVLAALGLPATGYPGARGVGVGERPGASVFPITTFFWIAVVLLLLMIVAAYAGG